MSKAIWKWLAAVAVLATTLVGGPAAGAPDDDVRRPYKAGGCADITDADKTTLQFNPVLGTLHLDALLGAPACEGVTFTLTVYGDEAGSGTPLAVALGTATASGVAFDVTNDPDLVGRTAVWVAGTSSDARGVIDRAPSIGTFTVAADGGTCDPADIDGCGGTNFR